MNEQEDANYDHLVGYAKRITYATETKGVQVLVKRCVKRFLQPQKYEVGFQGGSRFEYQVLTHKQAWYVLDGIELLTRMLYM